MITSIIKRLIIMFITLLTVFNYTGFYNAKAQFNYINNEPLMHLKEEKEAALKERQTPSTKLGYQPGEILVSFERCLNEETFNQKIEYLGGKIKRIISSTKNHQLAVVSISKETTVNTAIREYQSVKEVFSVQPNYVLKSLEDQIGTDDYDYKKTINADDYHSLMNDGKKAKVGVIDTGVNYYHKDLVKHVNQSLSKEVGENYQLRELRGDGYSGNFHVTSTQHGTNVSGVIADIAGDYADLVVVDAAPGHDNVVTTEAVMTALDYFLNIHVNVINVSFGYLSTDINSTVLKEHLQTLYANDITVVCAAGNDHSDSVIYPSDYGTTVGVIALDENNKKLSSSNYGKYKYISAPGENIKVPDLGNSYKTVSGTSMAAPQVSAAVALLYYNNPSITSSRVMSLLAESATDLETPGKDIYTGYGLLNIYKLLEKEKAEYLLKDFSNVKINAVSNQTYTGKPITPALTVSNQGHALIEKKDYTVSYTNNTEPGKATITVTGIGLYEGVQKLTFNILPVSLSNTVLETINNQIYTGTNIQPLPVLTYKGIKLVKDKDYKVTYTNNRNIGTATITITGMNHYSGTRVTTFRIVNKNTIKASGTLSSTSKWTLYENGLMLITGTLKDLESENYKYENYYKKWANYRDSIISVKLAAGIETIPDNMFYKCTKLRSITLTENVKSIGNSFNYCSSLLSITIPSKVTNIPGAAFYNCTSLKTVTFKTTKANIGPSAFQNCKSLTSITLPAPLTTDKGLWLTFNGCTSLKTVVIPAGYTKLGLGTFENCNSLQSITIPVSVTYIDEWAFNNCKSLKTIQIPSKLNYMGFEAFKNCQSLESITLPETLTFIGDHCFAGCKSLRQLYFPSSIKQIGASLCDGCTSLQTVKTSATFIDVAAFKNCKSLTSITTSSALQQINNETFYGCESLESYVVPSSVQFLGASVFEGCKSLESITFNESIVTIGDKVFKDCISLKQVIIPDSIILVGSSAFKNCISLESVTLGNNVEMILEETFKGCSSLKNVELTHNKYSTYIGDYAFEGTKIQTLSGPCEVSKGSFKNCSELKSINLSGDIAEYAFYNCDALESVIYYGINIHKYAFYHCDSLKYLETSNKLECICEGAFLKCGLTQVELLAHVVYDTSSFDPEVDIVVIDSIKIPKAEGQIGTVKWKLYDRGRLYIYGTGTVPEGICGEYDNILLYIYIQEGITSIGKHAFEGRLVKDIHFSDTVRTIDDYAFSNNKHLTYVDFNQIITIGDSAFYNSTINRATRSNLEYVGNNAFRKSNLSETPYTINAGKYAFAECTNLYNDYYIHILSGYMQEGVFYKCTNLRSVKDLSKVDAYAFYGCTNLRNLVDYNHNLQPESIGDYAFAGCTYIEDICLSKATYIGKGAFEGCTNLYRFSYMNNYIELDEACFKDCTRLSVAMNGYYQYPGNGSFTTIGAYAFYNCKSLMDIDLHKTSAIGDFAFGKCSTLDTVDANYVSKIGKGSFMNCTSLKEINIYRITSIDNYAFYNCNQLKITSVPLLNTIGSYAFGGCRNVKASQFTKVKNKAKYYCGRNYTLPVMTVSATYEQVPMYFKGSAEIVNLQENDQLVIPYNNNYMVIGTKYKKGSSYAVKVRGYNVGTSTLYVIRNNSIIRVYDLTVSNSYSNRWNQYYKEVVTTQTGVITKSTKISLASQTKVYSGVVQAFKPVISGSTGKYSLTYYTNKACTTKSSSKHGAIVGGAPKTVGTYYIVVKVLADGTYPGAIARGIKMTIIPKGTSFTSFVSKSKGFTVNWTKQATSTTGYQLQYALDSKFTSPKYSTITKTTILSKSIAPLKSKKKYYVRIRTYKTVGTAKYYSKWSTAKTITTK